MLLENLNIQALAYLERYVNNGSPSGFTSIYTTSKETSPFSLTPFIHPYLCTATDDNFTTFGKIPSFEEFDNTTGNNWLIVHPDMKDNQIFKYKNVLLTKATDIKLVPTASSRTLQLINSDNQGYFKLHYEGILGRIPRDLKFKKAVSGPEISELLTALIDQNRLDNRIAVMRETGARVLQYKKSNQFNEWGMVWREKTPYGVTFDNVQYIVPVFSLFGNDILAKTDKTLLEQIIQYKAINPANYVVDMLIFPMIDCYFNLISHSGIQPEWHAQNLLIGFSKDFVPVKFIMRDLESMDKDITLIEQLKLKVQFQSFPFKCIYRGQYNYQIKHSFMYDYKFGEYILQPLLNFLETTFKIKTLPILYDIKLHSRKSIENFPEDFFPKNKWYAFERVLIDQSKSERPYIELFEPKFRF